MRRRQWRCNTIGLSSAFLLAVGGSFLKCSEKGSLLSSRGLSQLSSSAAEDLMGRVDLDWGKCTEDVRVSVVPQ